MADQPHEVLRIPVSAGTKREFEELAARLRLAPAECLLLLMESVRSAGAPPRSAKSAAAAVPRADAPSGRAQIEARAKKVGLNVDTYLMLERLCEERGLDPAFKDAAAYVFAELPESMKRLQD